jgi:hypothetical protein
MQAYIILSSLLYSEWWLQRKKVPIVANQCAGFITYRLEPGRPAGYWTERWLILPQSWRRSRCYVALDVQREVVRVRLLFSSTEFTSIQWQFIERHIHSVTQGILCCSKTRGFLAGVHQVFDSTFFSSLFAILRRAAISVVMYVCPSVLPSVRLSSLPSVCTEQLGYHWRDFPKIWYLIIFLKSI